MGTERLLLSYYDSLRSISERGLTDDWGLGVEEFGIGGSNEIVAKAKALLK